MAEPSPFYARRPDRSGVHSLDHITLSVPDLTEARNFFTAFGLDVRTSPDALELRAQGNEHLWMVLTRGPSKRIGHISFGAFPDDIPAMAARLDAAGVARAAPPSGSAIEALWFHDPLGMLVEIRAAPKVMPDEKPRPVTRSCPAGERGAVMRGETAPVHPKRLAHALLFTPDIATSVQFYCDVLGLRISDFPGPVAFLHGPHGSDHHLIAFAQSDVGTGFHHAAWDVGALDEVGLGAAQMTAAGYGRGWGLGRHVLGSNYFHYVRDPWGSYSEYSFDIDFIPAEQDWPASYPPPENSLFLWGPDVPEDFVTNYERPETFTGDTA
jgi:catechol 2,3-dioxygenase-like lactoylglutathione lyase family enzyme